MELFIYIVSQGNTDKHLLYPGKMQTAFKEGLNSKGLIGSLRDIGKPISPDNIIYNLEFIELFQNTIRSSALQSEDLVESARRQGNGFIYIIDLRADIESKTDPCDIIGAFEVINGQIISNSFQANDRYEIISSKGLFKLPAIFEENILRATTL